ncbi:uncharacterized protein LOC134194364 [Corticium candelabrum]|uniref:uncharacterized protein LOC134194364 n=1 Tax=Corticium candelabrum TaxID=121492 RepID=UPI002E269B41|nr:uncharacterized protein LOC134194364 [Corticium candelabrum]
MRRENEKQRGCCCCSSGPLALSASVDRIGYCSGERQECPNTTIDVPPLPETLDTCSVLARDYYVEVAILVPKGRILHTYFPIIISSVPLHPSSQITGYVAIDSRSGRPPLPVPQSAYVTPVMLPSQFTGRQISWIRPATPIRPNERVTPRPPARRPPAPPPLPTPYIPPPPDRPPYDDDRENLPLLSLTTEVHHSYGTRLRHIVQKERNTKHV